MLSPGAARQFLAQGQQDKPVAVLDQVRTQQVCAVCVQADSCGVTHVSHVLYIESWVNLSLTGAGSANLHGPGTIALKLARSERRTEHATPEEVEDVSTPLTVCSSKEDVLFTIGAPLDSKQKPSRLHTMSPAQCTAKLGVRMLEPAPVPQAMMTSSAGNSRCNTAANSPEPSGAPPP